MGQRMASAKAFGLGAIVTLAFIVLTSLKLDSQGMYYDEIHQAPAAFFYIGKHPISFSYPVLGVPVLNMPYSGAIKSTIYGLYLHYVNPHFTVFSWRLLGILFVAAGLIAFYQTGGVWLSIPGMLVFA